MEREDSVHEASEGNRDSNGNCYMLTKPVHENLSEAEFKAFWTNLFSEENFKQESIQVTA